MKSTVFQRSGRLNHVDSHPRTSVSSTATHRPITSRLKASEMDMTAVSTKSRESTSGTSANSSREAADTGDEFGIPDSEVKSDLRSSRIAEVAELSKSRDGTNAYGRAEGRDHDFTRGTNADVVVYRDGRTLITHRESLETTEHESRNLGHTFYGVASSIDRETASAWLESRKEGSRGRAFDAIELEINPWAELRNKDRPWLTLEQDAEFTRWLYRQKAVEIHCQPIPKEAKPPVLRGRPLAFRADALILEGAHSIDHKSKDRDNDAENGRGIAVVRRPISLLFADDTTWYREHPDSHAARVSMQVSSKDEVGTGVNVACLRYLSNSLEPIVTYQGVFRRHRKEVSSMSELDDTTTSTSTHTSGHTLGLTCHLLLNITDRLELKNARLRFVNSPYLDGSRAYLAERSEAIPKIRETLGSKPRAMSIAPSATMYQQQQGIDKVEGDDEDEGIADGATSPSLAPDSGAGVSSYAFARLMDFDGDKETIKALMFEEEAEGARLMCLVDASERHGRTKSLVTWKNGEKTLPEGDYEFLDARGLSLGRIHRQEIPPSRVVEVVLGDAPDVSYRSEPSSVVKDPVVEGESKLRYSHTTRTLRIRNRRAERVEARVLVRLQDQRHDVRLSRYEGEKLSKDFYVRDDPVNDVTPNPNEHLMDVLLEPLSDTLLEYVVNSPLF